MSTLMLVRHGLSQSNAGLATRDPAEIELLPEGHTQAEALATRWSLGRPDRVVASPYRRTLQTALPLLRRFEMGMSPEVWTEAREFTYLSPPAVPQTPHERRPAVSRYWSEADVHRRDDGEGVESFAEFWARTRAFGKRAALAAADSPLIVIFTHGLLMAAFDLQCELPETVADPDLMRHLNQLRQSPIDNANAASYVWTHTGWRRTPDAGTTPTSPSARSAR